MTDSQEMKIVIDFRYINSHFQLVSCISPAFKLVKGTSVFFEVNLNSYSMLYSDYLLLLASSIKHLRETGIRVRGGFLNFNLAPDRTNYASRVNFFEHIGFNFEEHFCRRDPSGRFTEIIFFENKNSLEIYEQLMKVLTKDEINDEMLCVLHYCLWEVIDNTIRHSRSDGTKYIGYGHICAQYFPSKKEIRLIIADNGQGIHSALTGHPNSAYKHYGEEEAVLNCIERGVTNSTGMGFGLWATSTLISENGGQLLIHSGNYLLDVSNKSIIKKAPYWQGTYTFLRLNTDLPVNYELIFKDDAQKNSFDEFKEKYFGNIDNLW